MNLEHSMVIQWSHEDQKYIVTFPEFGGPHTHGSSYEDAAKNGAEVLELLIEAYSERKEGVPEPLTFGCPVLVEPERELVRGN